MNAEEQDEPIHVPDVIDQASNLERKAATMQIAYIQSKCVQARKPDAQGVFQDVECEDCGNDIPLERMQVAIRNNFCVHCLTLRERLFR